MELRRALAALATLALLAVAAHAQRTLQEARTYERFRELVTWLLDNRAPAARHLSALRARDKLQTRVPAQFPCAAAAAAPWRRSPRRPASAHRVRPGDVDVVGALGDSLSAGFGNAALMLTQVTLENRGWAFSGGGAGTWRDFLTLPNVLKEFNPNLTGFSERDSLSHQRASRFNVAEGGAISSDIPLQARNIVKRMRVDERVDLRNDWKLLSLMIGSNDFCTFLCYADDLEATVRRHSADLHEALDHLQAHLPRTIVNLIVSPDLNVLLNMTHRHPQCHVTQRFECPCLVGSLHAGARAAVLRTMRRWQQEERRVAQSERYRQREDFIVLLQPFLEHVVIPMKGNKTDLTLLSEDCFHMSQKGNAFGANGLWVNLMEPDDQKSTTWPDPLFSRFPCPTEDRPFIPTWGNNGGAAVPEAGGEETQKEDDGVEAEEEEEEAEKKFVNTI